MGQQNTQPGNAPADEAGQSAGQSSEQRQANLVDLGHTGPKSPDQGIDGDGASPQQQEEQRDNRQQVSPSERDQEDRAGRSTDPRSDSDDKM